MGNWERLVFNQRDALLAGLGVTVEVCAIAFLAAVIGGLGLCLVRIYVVPLRWIAVVLIEFFRDTPIFVQLMWVSYVWPEVFGFPGSFFTAGWLALALQSLISVITVPDLMSQSQRLVNIWYEPIEILTATAVIYILVVFLVSLTGKFLADRLRRRYGLTTT